MSEDPAGKGINWFRYCNNDPISHVDRNGKDSTWITHIFETASDEFLEDLATACSQGRVALANFLEESWQQYGDLARSLSIITGTTGAIPGALRLSLLVREEVLERLCEVTTDLSGSTHTEVSEIGTLVETAQSGVVADVGTGIVYGSF